MKNVTLGLFAGTSITDLRDNTIVVSFSFRTEIGLEDMYNASIPKNWRAMYRWRRYVKDVCVSKYYIEQYKRAYV